MGPGPDVLVDELVRHRVLEPPTEISDDAGVAVHDEGDDKARWVLVTGVMPHFVVHGWTTVGEAKRHGCRIGEG